MDEAIVLLRGVIDEDEAVIIEGIRKGFSHLESTHSQQEGTLD